MERIPKIIHYVWVGNQEKPKLVMDCIDSWKKYCPDYKIIEWNNNLVEEINNLYVQQAFANKKWAFVSDYLRLYVLYNYGGFYFDTDLELKSNLDQFCKHEFFTGFENYDAHIAPITALMGSQKNNNIIKELLDEYKNITFINNGKIDETTNVSRFSKYLTNKYENICLHSGQNTVFLDSNSVIYPYFYFCKACDGEKNYAIHHFSASWKTDYRRKVLMSLKKWRFVKFTRVGGSGSVELPLLDDEKTLCTLLSIGKRRFALLSINSAKR